MAVKTGLLPDRYTGAQPIGRGGMGEIYRATDTTLGRAVAVKVLDQRYAEDEAVRQRFTREALAVARLSGYPHIVTIYDVGEYRERPYIVMEYLAGGSLQERMRREGAIAPGQALQWLEQAAAALDGAHREGVIHRDVKPANLLLDRHDRVYVADFGIASAAGLGSLTQTGTVLGTASYLSPEQAKGERTTAASDLYSLAVVAFELLTGRRPFEGDSVAAEAAAHVSGQVPSVCDLNPDLPCELDPVFARALAKVPGDRYGSSAEFVAALRASLEEAAGATTTMPVASPPRQLPPPPPRAHRRRQPSWLVPALGAVILALLGAGIAYGLTRDDTTATPEPQPVRITTRVQTVTGESKTVVSTVITTAPAPTTQAAQAPTTSASASPGVGGDPYAENNRAWDLMKQGRYSQALPLLQDAVQQLSGRSDLGTAYANYNLGYTLMQLGRCSEALRYLETSRSIQPNRKEVKDAIKQARSC